MATEKSFHMTPDEFRGHGHAVGDWIADYYTRIESFPVLSRAGPGQIRASLPADPPVKGEPFPAILADIERLILPGITHWQSPNFYAYFPSNASGPGILGDLLSSGLGVQGMLWATSPACTELETNVLDWLGHSVCWCPKFSSHKRWGRGSGGRISPAMRGAAMENWWPTPHRRRIRHWRKALRSRGSARIICVRS